MIPELKFKNLIQILVQRSERAKFKSRARFGLNASLGEPPELAQLGNGANNLALINSFQTSTMRT